MSLNSPELITLMIQTLHNQGYENLYLYSGLSPSGINWRYEIGYCDNGCWPTDMILISDSITKLDSPAWASNAKTASDYAELFNQQFIKDNSKAKLPNQEYVYWYHSHLKTLSKDQPLTLYADYDYDYYHRILNNASGYHSI